MLRLLTVTELNSYLRQLLEADPIVADLWVEGEVVDFRAATSGHWYFKLRHEESTIAAACWRSYVARIGERPRNGDSVLAHGRVGFYENTGSLQFYVDMLRPAGVGLIQARFDELKARLEAEGLFNPDRKRPLPRMPLRIGIATSPTGAALQDILHVLGRRYPLAEVLVAPCQVQGDGAADTIVEALYALYAQQLDVIIVARGGGSAEDLWAFNEEIVARAIYASPVPVVTGVGHETDTTIVDYVADVRAPTPSAAAELVATTVDELWVALQDSQTRLTMAMVQQLQDARLNFADIMRQLQQHAPLVRIVQNRQSVDDLLRRAEVRLTHSYSLRRVQLDGLRARLEALNPQAILRRGYAVVRRADGQVVTAPEQVAPGDSIEITVRGGSFKGNRQ